jgi:hypothetical protein
MIFTDKFVYVHEPKTGGTFVTSVLFRLYGLKWTRLTHLRNSLLGEVRRASKYGVLVHNSNKHGGCTQIPAAHREKTILATVRNPFDLYVSQYEFAWWKRRKFLPYYRAVPDFERTYAHFPDITFAEYVRLVNAAFPVFTDGHTASADSPGLHTEQFFKYYFRQPREAFAHLDDEDYVAAQKYRTNMFKLHFIRTDRLNQGLYDFLLQTGYEHDDIKFILDAGKILPRGKGRSDAQKWERYYTPELKETVRRKERFLFRLFPEFDV